jgi:hypothetical protein
MIMDTEAWDEPHIKWETHPGKLLVIAFAGMASGLNELANFEFGKTTGPMDCSKIFCRDKYHAFFHLGFKNSKEITNINQIAARLQELIDEMSPSRISCIGVSAGGYAALLFGHLLEADTVHAFGPQVMLLKQWGIDNADGTVADCQLLHDAEIAPENDFKDLPKVLENYNGKTEYHTHVCNDSPEDLRHIELIKHLPHMEIIYYGAGGHAGAAKVLKGEGTLAATIVS